MSIGDFVNDSILLLKNGRYESAMCIAMNAMDATAKLEYPDLSKPGNVGERNLRFVRDNYDSISVVGTGDCMPLIGKATRAGNFRPAIISIPRRQSPRTVPFT